MLKYFYRLNFNFKKKFIVVSTTLFLSLLISVFYLSYIKYKYTNTKNTFQQFKIQKEIISKKKSNLQNYNKNIEDIKELKKDYETLNEKVISDKKVSLAIVYLSYLMESLNVTETGLETTSKNSLKIDTLEDGSEVLIYEIKISGVGKYEDVVEFTNSIANSNDYYKLKEISISTANAIKYKFVYVDVIVEVESFKLVEDFLNDKIWFDKE